MNISVGRLFAAVALVLQPAMAIGADASATVGDGAIGLGRLLLALVIVLGTVTGCAWLARRWRFNAGAGAGVIKIAGGATIGARERVIVLEIADTWIVAGISASGINALHTLPRPPQEPNPTHAIHAANTAQLIPSSFALRLRGLLEKRHA